MTENDGLTHITPDIDFVHPEDTDIDDSRKIDREIENHIHESTDA